MKQLVNTDFQIHDFDLNELDMPYKSLRFHQAHLFIIHYLLKAASSEESFYAYMLLLAFIKHETEKCCLYSGKHSDLFTYDAQQVLQDLYVYLEIEVGILTSDDQPIIPGKYNLDQLHKEHKGKFDQLKVEAVNELFEDHSY